MLYPPAALERAMTIREVMLRAMSGAINWRQAAENHRVHRSHRTPLARQV